MLVRQFKDNNILGAPDLESIKKSVVPELRKLSQLKPWRSFFTMASTWGVVVFMAMLSLYTHSLAIYVFSVFVIASRQHLLVGLMHEGVHLRLHKSEKINNFLSDWICAYPVLMKTSIYRRHHLLHHRNLNTPNDPDWARKVNLPEWQFPMSKAQFIKIYSKYLWGYGVVETVKLCLYLSGLNRQNLKLKEARVEALGQVAYYSIWFTLIFYFKIWPIVLFFWIIPACTVFPIIMKIRSVAEHFGLENSHELNGTRNIEVNWFENFFIIPINLSYHLDHHLFPTVPFYNLQRIHAELLKYDVYKSNSHQNTSILGSEESALGKDLLISI